ncbi:MAG: hypothetical protein LC108_01910 [Anaerolineales bacterium]|nr:hypothetical protein [Anaerolineales bacterium]
MRKSANKLIYLLAIFALTQLMCTCGMSAQGNAYIYEDLNGNGTKDANEGWLPNISVSWAGADASSDRNGVAYLPGRWFDTGSDCSRNFGVAVHVPEGYKLTQPGYFYWDCNEIFDGVFKPGGEQFKQTMIGLQPISITPTPIAALPAQPTATPQPAHPAITLVKSVDHTACSAVNEKFIYTYTFTNTGDVPLTGFTLTDDKIEFFDCPQDSSKLTLPPGKSASCYGAYFIKPQELKFGETVHNSASVSSSYLNQAVISNVATQDVYCKAPLPPSQPEPTTDPCLVGPPFPEGCD